MAGRESCPSEATSARARQGAALEHRPCPRLRFRMGASPCIMAYAQRLRPAHARDGRWFIRLGRFGRIYSARGTRFESEEDAQLRTEGHSHGCFRGGSEASGPIDRTRLL